MDQKDNEIGIEDARYPHPKLHQQISFLKSFGRIVAGVFLCSQMFFGAGVVFIISELLGIIEELV